MHVSKFKPLVINVYIKRLINKTFMTSGLNFSNQGFLYLVKQILYNACNRWRLKYLCLIFSHSSLPMYCCAVLEVCPQ